MHVVIVGAGINGLVAANYLRRSGSRVTMIERAARVGGACVPATAEVDGVRQDYAHGASVLGLMQDFVFEETGLAARLETFAPTHPKLIHFPGQDEPIWIWREPERLDREFEQKFGERGDAVAFRADEARVVDFLQRGYREARPPTVADAEAALGAQLTRRWITGSARDLLEHYFTSDGARVYMAMTVTESGPVALSEPYSAFIVPMMD
jgi:phytoene dehydrogenase-like protein